MNQVLRNLKIISPSLQNIKLDKKRAEVFPDLLQVLECHSTSCDYIIQFFKNHLIACLHLQGVHESLIQAYPHANSSVCEVHGVSHADAHFEAS